MPLAQSHSLPNKKDRKAKPYLSSIGKGKVNSNKKYEEAEKVIDQLYCDICNGVSKSDCMQKLVSGHYGREMKQRNATDYYKAAISRLKYNADVEAKELRDLLYNRYETVLEECMKNGDVFNARATLDSIAKVFLGADKQQNNIQINNNSEGITIKFGFANDNEEMKDAEFEEM